MISWVYAVLIGVMGFFLGALVMSLAAMAKCADCRMIGQMFGKDEP